MARTSNMTRHARRTATELRQGARRVRHAAEQEANGFMHNVQQLGQDAKERFDDLRDSAAEYVAHGRKKAMAAEQTMERTIKQRPILAVVGAVGCGFVLGRLYSFYRRLGRTMDGD